MTADAQAPTVASPAPPAPLLVDARAAARLCDISRTLWFSLLASGRAPRGLRLGRCRRWSVAELEAWTQAGCPPRARWEARRQEESR